MPTDQGHSTDFIQAFQSGEEKAFDFFFRKYYPALCFFAGSYLSDHDDAKDLVQDCFIKLWNVRASIKNPDSLKSYLYTMVRNSCLHAIRQEKKVIRINTELQYLSNPIILEEQHEITHAEMIRQIHERMEELPARMREVFQQYYIEGKSQAAIAYELRVSPITVRNQRLRALALIREEAVLLTALALFL